MIKVAVAGVLGKMGSEVVKAVNDDKNAVLTGAVDIKEIGKDSGILVLNAENNVKIVDDISKFSEKPDVIVDFTQPSAIFENAVKYIKNGIKPVIGTTGMSSEQINELKSLSEKHDVGCFIAPNFTTGAVLMMMFAQTAAKYFDNAEIIEYHHNQKKDAPSGTALKTAELMAAVTSNAATGNCPETELLKGSRGGIAPSDIHVHSVRMPGYMASQEVLFGSKGQILSIRHDSVDRACYMPGVLMAIKYVVDTNKFVYGLDNIL